MSSIIDQSKKDMLTLYSDQELRTVFISHYSKLLSLEPEMIEVHEGVIKLSFIYLNKSGLSFAKRYYFMIIFNVKNYQFILSARWVLNELPMKSKINQANYFYAFQACRTLQDITGDKNLKLAMNSFNETFGITWSILLDCYSMSQFLQKSNKMLEKVLKSLISKLVDIDYILNYFLIGIPANTPVSSFSNRHSTQQELAKLILLFSTYEFSNKPSKQRPFSSFSNQKFVDELENSYIKVSKKIEKLVIASIYGSAYCGKYTKLLLSVCTLNKLIFGNERIILQQETSKEQIVVFINVNIKACNLQKGKKSFIKLSFWAQKNITAASTNTNNFLKIKIEMPANTQEQFCIIHENLIVSTFFPRFKSKHFLKYYINISSMKQIPLRMTLDHKYITLQQFLSSRQGMISFKTKIYILSQILQGMKKLWKQGIIYLGLTSSTVLVQWKKGRMNVRISNFGNSFQSQLCNNNISYKPNLECQYIAPQLKQLLQTQQPISFKQDIYSFGVVMCEMFFHKFPKTYYKAHTIIKQHIMLKVMARNGLKWEDNFQQIIAKLVKQCLQICPEDRPDPEFLSLILGYLTGY